MLALSTVPNVVLRQRSKPLLAARRGRASAGARLPWPCSKLMLACCAALRYYLLLHGLLTTNACGGAAALQLVKREQGRNRGRRGWPGPMLSVVHEWQSLPVAR